MLKRARSPVTVTEWVAALPDTEPADNDTANDDDDIIDNDADNDMVLGAEAGMATHGNTVAKLLLQRNNSNHHSPRKLQHSDTASSLRSTMSHLSSVSHLSASR